MSETPRKVKNPLLNAAGIGFPFDNFTENNILMPVTPATPAILPDGEFEGSRSSHLVFYFYGRGLYYLKKFVKNNSLISYVT